MSCYKDPLRTPLPLERKMNQKLFLEIESELYGKNFTSLQQLQTWTKMKRNKNKDDMILNAKLSFIDEKNNRLMINHEIQRSEIEVDEKEKIERRINVEKLRDEQRREREVEEEVEIEEEKRSEMIRQKEREEELEIEREWEKEKERKKIRRERERENEKEKENLFEIEKVKLRNEVIEKEKKWEIEKKEFLEKEKIQKIKFENLLNSNMKYPGSSLELNELERDVTRGTVDDSLGMPVDHSIMHNNDSDSDSDSDSDVTPPDSLVPVSSQSFSLPSTVDSPPASASTSTSPFASPSC